LRCQRGKERERERGERERMIENVIKNNTVKHRSKTLVEKNRERSSLSGKEREIRITFKLRVVNGA